MQVIVYVYFIHRILFLHLIFSIYILHILLYLFERSIRYIRTVTMTTHIFMLIQDITANGLSKNNFTCLITNIAFFIRDSSIYNED